MHVAFINPQGNFDPLDSHWTAHPDFGGQLVYVKQVALAMAAQGHRVDIITRRIVDPDWPEFAAPTDSYPGHPRVRILRVSCGPLTFLPKEELWPYIKEWTDGIIMLYEVEGRRPDICTGHYADGGLACALIERRLGIPFTFTVHSPGAWKLDHLLASDDIRKAYPNSRAALPALERRFHFGARIAAERTAMVRSGTIVTSTDEERCHQYCHPAYRDIVNPEDDQHFSVIPPGVNLHIFDPAARSPREEQIREMIAAAVERDIPPHREHLPLVIAWSRLDRKKNHVGLVRAFAQSPQLQARANLVMITRGLQDPLHRLDMAPRVEKEVLEPVITEVERSRLWGGISCFHLEGQDAAAALYRWGVERQSVFCLPAEHEPFGLSLIEAMAVGLPSVATNQGGPVEITDQGQAGLLASPDDYDEIASQLLRLVSDPQEWKEYATRGRERVVRYYSWKRTAERYLRLCDEIVRGIRRGDCCYPLPTFVCVDDPVELPQIDAWTTAPSAAPR